MADEPEVKPSEAPDESATADVVASEAASGNEAPAAAAPASAEAEREAFIAQVAQRVAELIQKPSTPTPTPPTTAGGNLDPLEREAASILAEQKALDDEVARDGGWSAATIIKRQDLKDRISSLRTEALLHGMRLQEEQRTVESFGSDERWQKFYRENKGRGDVQLLRAAFERDELKAQAEAAAKEPKPPIVTKPIPDRRPIADVSGPVEVNASERKARTMTREQVQAQKRKLEDEGKFAEVRELDRSIRNGDVILK